MTSIVEVIQHYQRSIDSNQDNEARLLHCINKLYKLPIKVEHLQETGVGKTVNSLRKFNGEIGVAAKTLVTKWKAMVAAEEEAVDTTSETNESGTYNDDNDEEGTTPLDEEDDENHNRSNASRQHEQNKCHSGDKKGKHKERQSSNNGQKDNKQSTSSSQYNCEKSSSHSHSKHKSSSSSRDKPRESQHKTSSHKEKEREKEKTDHKSNRDKYNEKDHVKEKDKEKEKEKERNDKKREEKSKSDKSDKEHKIVSPNAHSSHHKSSSNSNSTSSKSKHDDKHSSTSKEKYRSEKYKTSSKDKERTRDVKPSFNTSSKDKADQKSPSVSSTFNKSSTKDPDSADRKRRHNSDNDSNDFKSPQPKVAKTQKSSASTPAIKSESKLPHEATEEHIPDDSFDSSMGANFDDVLGMLNIPIKKSKKSLKSPTMCASSTNSTKKDTISQKPTASNSTLNKVNGTKLQLSPNSSLSCPVPSTSKDGTLKLDLLAPTAKLEPLDPSIALELPTISTNYKPMPLNQTVMDCVFNNISTSSKPARTLTDAEAITHGISSKTIRTKIYSGIKTGQTYQVPTLFDMCIRILQKNIDALEYTGGVPFEVLKPVLERATPQQLYVFEEYNPYLMEDSDILWQQHVSRSYRTKKRLENESWREMFIRCQEEDERRLSILKDSIKASQKIAAAPVRKTQLAFVDSMVKPPRNVLKKQEQYGTKAKLVATPAARVASLSSVTPNAAKTGDQRLKVPATARDHAQVSSSAIRPKKAPLMQKTLQFIRGRHKR